RLDGALPQRNNFVAIRVDARFASIMLRSVHRQEPPYKPLTEVAESQSVWTHEDLGGTLVGVRCPSWVGGLNVPGYHWHFLSDDRKVGGHVLDCRVREGRVRYDVCRNWEVKLPESQGFDEANLTEDARGLKRVELRGRATRRCWRAGSGPMGMFRFRRSHHVPRPLHPGLALDERHHRQQVPGEVPAAPPTGTGLVLQPGGWVPVDDLLPPPSAAAHQLRRPRRVRRDERQAAVRHRRDWRPHPGQPGPQRRGGPAPGRTGPPVVLYSTVGASAPILAEGLNKGKRHHVHLSEDVETARKVGARRASPSSSESPPGGCTERATFFVSANGVWLTDAVPRLPVETMGASMLTGQDIKADVSSMSPGGASYESSPTSLVALMILSQASPAHRSSGRTGIRDQAEGRLGLRPDARIRHGPQVNVIIVPRGRSSSGRRRTTGRGSAGGPSTAASA
ncbi:MAG: acetolactate decarboxylase, partial [Singulisphaera sp.]